MKQIKPRNYVALALSKRNGAGAHQKSTKAKRIAAKRQLCQELRQPSTIKVGGFFIDCGNISVAMNIDFNT